MITSSVTVKTAPQLQRFAGKKPVQSPPMQIQKPEPQQKPAELQETQQKESDAGNLFEQENFFLFRWIKRVGRLVGIKMEKGISKLEAGHEEELLESEYTKIQEKVLNQRVVVNKVGAAYLKAKDEYERMELQFKQQQEEAMIAFRAMKKASEEGNTDAAENLKKMAIVQQKKAQNLEPRLATMRERVKTAESQKQLAEGNWERIKERRDQLRLQVDELKDKARMTRLMKQERELNEELQALAGDELALGNEFQQIANRIKDAEYFERAASSESLRTAEEMLAQQKVHEYQEAAASENALAELERKFAAEADTTTEEKKETLKTMSASSGGVNSVADATE